VIEWLKTLAEPVLNLDKLTYAGNLENLAEVEANPLHTFIHGDIGDTSLVAKLLIQYKPRAIINFAAESHVDRSIIDPLQFVKTNVLGTANLLEAALNAKVKRFHHISTDEVYGSLGPDDLPFTEKTNYAPRSPYAASKAGSDYLVRAYFETYNLPVTITNCANNYGPFHDPEKLIPRFITNLLEGKKVPLMGKGENIREWLHVEDHAQAIDFVLQKGQIGETYLIEGEEKANIGITQMILKMLNLDESMIEFVDHRLGHDFRYAINGQKLKSLGWIRKHSLEKDLPKVVEWFKTNEWWWKSLKMGRPNVDRSAQKGYER